MSVERMEAAVEATRADTSAADTSTTVTSAAETSAAVIAAAVAYYPVAPGVRLNVRSGPGTSYPIVRVLAEGTSVPIYCQTPGTSVSGPYGTTNIWDNIADSQFVSDAYVHTGSDGYVAPHCG